MLREEGDMRLFYDTLVKLPEIKGIGITNTSSYHEVVGSMNV